MGLSAYNRMRAIQKARALADKKDVIETPKVEPIKVQETVETSNVEETVEAEVKKTDAEKLKKTNKSKKTEE